MKNVTTQDFRQPSIFGDVTIQLYSVLDLVQGQTLFLERSGSYTVQIIDHGLKRVLARRFGAGDDLPDGRLIPAGTSVAGSFIPGPETVNFGGPLSAATGVMGVLITPEEMKELRTLRALRDHLKKRAQEAEMAGRNKDPNLIAEKARRAKIAPWMVRATAAQEVGELDQNLNQLSGIELASAVSRAVALYYEEDPTVAGLVTAALSCLPGEPEVFYASLVRYTQGGGGGKSVVGPARLPASRPPYGALRACG